MLAEPIVVKDFFSFINSSDIVCIHMYARCLYLCCGSAFKLSMEGGGTIVLFYCGLFFSS